MAFQAVVQGGSSNTFPPSLLFQATPFHLSVLSAISQLLGTWAQLRQSLPLVPKSENTGPLRDPGAGAVLDSHPGIAAPVAGGWPMALALRRGSLFCLYTLHHTGLDHPDHRFAECQRSRNVLRTTIARHGRCQLSGSDHWRSAVGPVHTAPATRDRICRHLFSRRFVPGGLRYGPLQPSRFAAARAGENPTGFPHFLQHGASRNFHRFLLYSGLMHAAVLVAGPLFVIYMIRDLHLSYWQYGTWMGAGLVGQLMTFTAWGRFSDRFGNKALLTVTGSLVPVLPMLYLLGTAWPFLGECLGRCGVGRPLAWAPQLRV